MPLTIDRPASVAKGEPATLSCTFAFPNLIVSEDCIWQVNRGVRYRIDADSGDVFDESNPSEPVEGLSGSMDIYSCTLDIKEVKDEHLKEWSCILNGETEGIEFHKGTFQLMTNSYLKDIRIPRHMAPTRYDLVVEALGGHGEHVTDPAEIRPALERAFASGKPALVNVEMRKDVDGMKGSTYV